MDDIVKPASSIKSTDDIFEATISKTLKKKTQKTTSENIVKNIYKG